MLSPSRKKVGTKHISMVFYLVASKRAALLMPSMKIWFRFSFLLHLLKQAWSDPEIRPQYFWAVFLSVGEGYSLH